jgi:DNA-binding transcriptional ArsR family regulator
MARAATSSDAFNAVAEPRRREILSYLALGERSVGEIVAALECGQPSVSKHLRVLREVGLVRARREGRRTLCRIHADGLRPLHEWTATFERLWRHQLQRVKQRAEQRTRVDQRPGPTKLTSKKEKRK